MANLLLTNYCNRQCPYCFAVDAMNESETRRMTVREIVLLADQIIASGLPTIGLLGGEPTLHPEFTEIVEYFIRRNVRPRIFTNGIVKEETLTKIDALPRQRYRFIVNVNAPEEESERNRAQQLAFLRRYVDSVELGVNVYKPDMDLGFLVETAEATGLKNSWIRVGIAQPIVGESNQYLALEHYQSAATSLVALADRAIERRLRLTFDCGFPLCAFTDEQLGRLYRYKTTLKFSCQSAVDIAPGGDSWACFPLAKQTPRHYDASSSVTGLSAEFARDMAKMRKDLPAGIFDECATCLQRELGACDGGCLSHLVCRHEAVDAAP